MSSQTCWIGDPSTQNSFGICFQPAIAVQSNQWPAAHCFELSAMHGNPNGTNNLAFGFKHDRGGKQEIKSAEESRFGTDNGHLHSEVDYQPSVQLSEHIWHFRMVPAAARTAPVLTIWHKRSSLPSKILLLLIVRVLNWLLQLRNWKAEPLIVRDPSLRSFVITPENTNNFPCGDLYWNQKRRSGQPRVMLNVVSIQISARKSQQLDWHWSQLH